MSAGLVALFALASAAGSLAYDTTFAFNSTPVVETRSLDEIYAAAVKEGGVVTLWHGGDEKTQQDGLKKAFEARFPKMTLNVTVDVSKYHDGKIDEQLATDNVYVDSVILQTLHDYPRWKQEGALLHYAPAGFDRIHPAYRDVDAAYYGYIVFGWTSIWNTDKLDTNIEGFADFVKPEFKDKLVLTYPNDDDAVLFAFNLILQRLGTEWFDALLAQNPRWVRGTATPVTLLSQANDTVAATFTSSIGLVASAPLNISLPVDAPHVTWPQTAAILANAPHPEGAKLLHNYLLDVAFQNSTGTWSVRTDVPPPPGYPPIMDTPGANPTGFREFMADRAYVERLRFWLENRLGTAQGLSPLIDDL